MCKWKEHTIWNKWILLLFAFVFRAVFHTNLNLQCKSHGGVEINKAVYLPAVDTLAKHSTADSKNRCDIT